MGVADLRAADAVVTAGGMLEEALALRFPAMAAYLEGLDLDAGERLAELVVEANVVGVLQAAVAEVFDDAGPDTAPVLALAAEEALLRHYGVRRRLQPELAAVVTSSERAVRTPAGLVWDDDVPRDLPLRALAQAIADRDGTLTVVAGAPGWGDRAGVHGLWTAGVAVVMTAPWPTMARWLAHELGHAIDPRRADPTLTGVESEVFARAAEPVLLRRQPRTLNAAQPAIEAGEQARAGLIHRRCELLPPWPTAPTWWPMLFGGPR